MAVQGDEATIREAYRRVMEGCDAALRLELPTDHKSLMHRCRTAAALRAGEPKLASVRVEDEPPRLHPGPMRVV